MFLKRGPYAVIRREGDFVVKAATEVDWSYLVSLGARGCARCRFTEFLLLPAFELRTPGGRDRRKNRMNLSKRNREHESAGASKESAAKDLRGQLTCSFFIITLVNAFNT